MATIMTSPRDCRSVRSVHAACLAAAALVAATGVACNKDSTDAPAGSSTSLAPAASSSSVLVPIKYGSELPARGTAPVTQKAVRGGSGATVISASSRIAAEEDTNREMRKPATVDKADCTVLPDNAAECDGDKFYFCDDKQLWVTDCNAEAKFGGATGGSCYEGDSFIDCLGSGTASDGSTESCDFSRSVCCDKDGACFTPAKS